MDGYSSGIQFGQSGYIGKTGYTSNASQSSGVDVTQLQAGDSFKGEIASVNGEDVQILLSNGQLMNARLERDVQVALGQILNLQVQSNKDNKVVLKPIYDANSQLMRVGEAALRAANITVNTKNLNLVSNLLQNGMSIDKNTIMQFNRLAIQNPDADISQIIELNKLKLPVTESNLNQLTSYENMNHKLLDGIAETADEVTNLFTTIADCEGSAPVAATRFMQKVIDMLTADETVVDNQTEGQSVDISDQGNVKAQAPLETVANENITKDVVTQETVANEPVNKEFVNKEPANNEPVNNEPVNKENVLQDTNFHQSIQAQQTTSRPSSYAAVAKELAAADPKQIPSKIEKLINDGKLDLKDVKQLLNDDSIGGKLTDLEKTEIFKSQPFKSILKSGLENRWTITPNEIATEGKVEEFYEKLARETSKLAKMMNEAISESGTDPGTVQTKAVSNMNENIEFMNQINHMMNYVQLPLKLSDSNAHGDLYVYSNKKSMAGHDATLTAFMHLDMDNLGSLDVSIALDTRLSQVTTKFYLDEDSIGIIEEHKGELIERLSQKGYKCKTLVEKKDEDKSVIDIIEEQSSGQNAMIRYQTFDTRA